MDKKNARKARQRKLRNRRIALTLCLMLTVAVASIGGTIAWLTDKSSAVTNTFVSGNIRITLDEGKVYEPGDTIPKGGKLGGHKDNGETRVQKNVYQAIPGNTYDKDPIVTVEGGSEDCWLFVKFEETGNPATYYTYTSALTSANGWTKGNGTGIPSNVWYRTNPVPASTQDQPFALLTGNTITVKDTVTQDDMTAAASASLKWTAYAVQSANVADVATAWSYIENDGQTPAA